MNKISILALACCALLLASCGKKHEAKSTVKEFISANFTDNDYSIESYTDIDSTNYVTPEAIKLMRQNMAQSNAYKKGIAYADKKGKQLMYMTVTMETRNEEANYTFYLKPHLKAVAPLKD